MDTFQIVSDLHIEVYDDNNINPLEYITPSADILILAGDIGSLYKFEQLFNFIKNIAEYFKYVLYVPGNHEYYMINNYEPLDFKTLELRLNLLKKIHNLIVLNQESVIVEDICIVGCTLWSKPYCKVPNFIVRIKDFNTQIYTNKYTKDLNYIKYMINYCKNKKYKLLVITHYPPTYLTLQNAKKRDKFLSLYANHLDYLLNNNTIHTWICGHTHHNFDFKSNHGTRVVSNQKGKPKDKIIDYNKKFLLKL